MMGLMPGMAGLPGAMQGMAGALNPLGQLPGMRPGALSALCDTPHMCWHTADSHARLACTSLV
jgi:hypothetical protein